MAAAVLTGFAPPVMAAAADAEMDAEQVDLQPSAPEGFQPLQYGLNPEPLRLAPLGLAMYAPQARMRTDRAAGRFVATLSDPAATPSWSLTIQHLHTAAPSTPEEQIQQHLAALQAEKRDVDVIENTALTAGNLEGRLCYIRQAMSAEGDESIVTGWFILPAGPDVLLVFSILVMPDHLPLLRPVFEAAFQTVNLRPISELSLERRSHMDAGRNLLAGVTPERLRTLLGTQQWSRLYRVDDAGTEQEVGYSLLKVYEAKRGALDPGRPESAYSRSEQEEGIMVKLQGRIIGNLERRMFYDSIALYWMAWDQSEEAWNVRGTQRQGQAERSESETGLRLAATTGNPLATLTVVRHGVERDSNEWAVPDVYLSQALGAVIGRLLPRDLQRPREYSYYFYNYSHTVPQLTKRTDRWEQTDAGRWQLTTQLSVDAPPIVSLYSPTGEFIETRRGDGTITVPTPIEQIRRIWMRKGLPMGD